MRQSSTRVAETCFAVLVVLGACSVDLDKLRTPLPKDDVGSALTSPQTMGITVGAGATIDVVIYSVTLGTDSAGSYALSCNTE